MRIIEIMGGLQMPISKEEEDIYDKIAEEGIVYKSKLNEREQEVARKMVSRGALDRYKGKDGIYFNISKNDNLWIWRTYLQNMNSREDINEMKDIIKFINEQQEENPTEEEFRAYALQEAIKIKKEQNAYTAGQPLDMTRFYGGGNRSLMASPIQEATGELPTHTVPNIPPPNPEIVDRFHDSVSKVAETLVEDSKVSSQVKEQLMTQETKNGIRVGRYEISIKLDPNSKKEKKIYEIVDMDTSSILASDIRLYETAKALVKLLNKGKKITDFPFMDILNLENSFQSHRSDAAMFKKKSMESVKRGDEHKAIIYESRYDRAKSDAIRVARCIQAMNNKIRL